MTRSWTNGAGYAGASEFGPGWVADSLPHLSTDGSAVAAVLGGTGAFFFDPDGAGGYAERHPFGTALAYDAVAGVYTLTDGTGAAVRFYGFASYLPPAMRGGFQSYTSPAGEAVEATAWDAFGHATEVRRTLDGGVTESYLYAFGGSGAAAGVVTAISLRRSADGGATWSPVRSAEYTYYDFGEAHGTAGDLKLVTVKDAAGNPIDTSYYRYYKAGESGGYQHALKFAFGPAAYARLAAALGTSVDALSDAQADDYADFLFEYDSQRRVVREVASGEGCSACAGGQGEYTYAYTASGNSPGANSWAVKTVMTLPDGTTDAVFTDSYGRVMLKDHANAAGSQHWIDYYRYDAGGRVVLHAAPSAVTGYDDAYPDLVADDGLGDAYYLADSTGLYTVYSYFGSTTATTTTAGGAAGYRDTLSLRHGETGTNVPQESRTYIARAAGAHTVYAVASTTVYRNDNGTGGQTTTFGYDWFTGTTQVRGVLTTLPAVTTGQNGSGAATSASTMFDAKGRVTWQKDQAGYITYTAYDDATGGVVKTITDVNTANTSDFAGLPSGWSTPSGGGLHLVSTYEVDSLGRTTKATSPGGVVVYTTYNDANHEVRSYTWDPVNGVRVGPTTVVREDRAGGYVETLTMSATPATSGGRPTGTEAISGLLTLSRSYTNSARQVVYRDDYFSLSGVSYSTVIHLGNQNLDYYRTSFGYDKQGRPNKVVSPAGTITRTEYDAAGRAVSVWVGTDDTPATGFWSTSNLTGTDMTKVADYEYDGGAAGGDSNLTKVTQYPGLSAPARVAQTYYDWRGRAVATKAGVEGTENTSVNRPITYTDYDNPGEATRVRVYDGDGVTVTSTGGVPNAPSSSLLRAQTTYAYDELGRVYQSKVYSVSPSSGSVSSSALTTDVWYDSRGFVVKTAAPGGLVSKTSYDGAGRVTATYATDGGGDTGYADADDVAGDTVLSQGEYSYNADGQVILSTARERFHDATGTGALGSPSSTTQPKARVSYAASYYDAAGRLVASVDVGTNGGTAYTRPSSVPSRSDTVLVTSYEYDAAGQMWKVTSPRGIESRTEYDALGRTVKTVENYVDGVASDADDKTTTYTYGPAGLTALKAWTSSSAGQTTEYVYGVTAGMNGVSSNDVRAATKWPDPNTGAASGSEQELVTVNALGQVVSRTDRNGTTHAYTYDVLARLTADAVPTLGSLTPALDGTVARVDYGYDALGKLSTVTSYNAVSGGSVVNQVQREYNGLGQLVKEYQAHGGAVNTSTTPAVTYAYSEMASGANHSRQTSVTYPGGYVLGYDYGEGLDDAVSRLSAVSSGWGPLEAYAYLGLGTVVVRDRGDQSLSYLKMEWEADGDAGDQYNGLDRFGRVADQRWLDLDTTDIIRFRYGYDRGGNRLWAENVMAPGRSELYSYDGLGQITSFDRGTLNGTKTGLTGSAARSTDWDFDALGNFQGVDVNGTITTRTHNAQNEVTSVGSNALAFDPNGNMLTDETGRQFRYDAWNRPVKVMDSSGNVLKTYVYDGLGRRITETPNGGSTTDLYHSAGWQVLEERVGGATTARYVWSPTYVDALVLRDRDTDNNGTLDERLYAVQDANWNVVAVTPPGGIPVAEYYEYDPFGARTGVSDNDRNPLSGSAYAWTQGFQGMFFDPTAGLAHQRARWYSPTLGRWATNDPMGFAAGDVNFYRMVGNGPTGRVDPTGMCDWLDTLIPALPLIRSAGTAYSVSRESGENVPTSLMMGGLMGAADATGVTNIEAAYQGEELYTNRPLSNTERGVRGTLGTVQVVGTVVGIRGFGGPSAAACPRMAAPATAGPKVCPTPATPPPPARFYSARELVRRAEDTGPNHNFPESFNPLIFEEGSVTRVPGYFKNPSPGLSSDTIQYRLQGSINGRDGVYEIFTRPSVTGNTEVIYHRFFLPNKKCK